MGFPGDSNGKESTCNAEDLGSIPGLGRYPREGNGNSLQYSCLENSMDRGAWWTTAHGVAKSRTWLNDFTFTCQMDKLMSAWFWIKWYSWKFSEFHAGHPFFQSSVIKSVLQELCPWGLMDNYLQLQSWKWMNTLNMLPLLAEGTLQRDTDLEMKRWLWIISPGTV